ncbi:MAG: nucleotidyl transferase AbiEii/AbiGii toxin family protein [Candidatus Absconditabacterales bacterium]
MLSLEDIKTYYPPMVQDMPRHLLREYLQYKILQHIFDSKHANKLCFIGGTALRIVYNNQRFSEDLDFDNFNLSINEFEDVIQHVAVGLEHEGLTVETRNIYKGAYHCHIKFPNILFDNELSGYKTENILIKIDTYGQGHDFTVDKKTINEFDVTTSINIAPLSLILSHKLCTIFNRKTHKGRDFFDIVYILSKTKKPDRNYIKKYLNIENPQSLKDKILTLIKDIDLKKLNDDVMPFLFYKEDKKVLNFKEIIEQTEFET